jgi:hypothetical protein
VGKTHGHEPNKAVLSWPVVLWFVGIACVTVVMSAEAGILWLAPIVLLVAVVLSAVLSRHQLRATERRVSTTGDFLARAVGKPCASVDAPLEDMSLGLNNGPSGKLAASQEGISWRPKSPRRSRVPAFEAQWSDVARIEIEPIRRLGDPAFVHVGLRSGVRRSVLTGSATSFRAIVERYAPGCIPTP